LNKKDIFERKCHISVKLLKEDCLERYISAVAL